MSECDTRLSCRRLLKEIFNDGVESIWLRRSSLACVRSGGGGVVLDGWGGGTVVMGGDGGGSGGRGRGGLVCGGRDFAEESKMRL